MAGRASIVGAAETSVGKVRDHNEDSHFIDPEAGIFVVCDGMGGHAAGEVASALAVKTVRKTWSSDATEAVCERWLKQGTPEARKALISTIQQGVLAAHDAIVAEASADKNKKGMGTTLVGAMVVGGDAVFAHAGDSRAYLVRDGIAMQLTEDHTLLARLLAAGVDVDTEGEGMRFKSMLTNALGIGDECKVSTFVVPLADGDRFLLCSDGITEYVKEAEIGEVLTTQPSPARSAQRLVELALNRGGGDNATALVVRVLEAGETARPSSDRKREEQAINACPIWGKTNPQQRLRALRIALPRDYAAGEKLPAQTLGDRVAWIIVEGELEQDGLLRGPGSLIYPEALLTDRPLPDKDGLAVTQSEVRALALRSDDFRELCDDDPELGEVLLAALAAEIAARKPARRTGRIVVQADPVDGRGATDPGDEGRANTLQMHALTDDEPAPPPAKVLSELAHATTLPPGEDIGRANTLQMQSPFATPAPSLAPSAKTEPLPRLQPRAATAPPLPPPPIVIPTRPPAAIQPIPAPPKLPEAAPKQPRASTAPPIVARTRSSTDIGAPTPDRPPAAPSIPPPMGAPSRAPSEPPEPPERPHVQRVKTRPTTPPTGFIATPDQTEEALDRAMSQITGERPASSDESQPEIIVEATPSSGASEPAIVIEALEAEAAAPAPAADEPSDEVEMVMTVEDDSAKVVEVLKETSSQTISLTIEEPPEPEITVEKD